MKIAVFGELELIGTLRIAVWSEGHTLLDSATLETCDEWQTRRWFNENAPDLVLIAVQGVPERDSRELLANTQGLINVLNSALGRAKALRVFGFFGSNTLFMLRRLCELYRQEKDEDFRADLVRDRLALSNVAVLIIRDVQAKETNSEESSVQSREVRDEMVPEPESAQQHRLPATALLEVPVAEAQREASGDLHSERYAPEGAGASDPVHHNPGSV